MSIKSIVSLICLMVILCGCKTVEQHALVTAPDSQMISLVESNQKVQEAQNILNQKFDSERESYQSVIKNLQYTLECLRADTDAGQNAFNLKFSLITGKVFEVQQRRLFEIKGDKDTQEMWGLVEQAYNSGNTEGVNIITSKILKNADETSVENGKLKTELDTAKKETDAAKNELTDKQEVLNGEIEGLKKELKENLAQNEITLQNVIKQANDKNIRQQQAWLNAGAMALLFAAIVLFGIKLWLKADIGKWALLAGISCPALFWLSQTVGKEWFLWGFGGIIVVIIGVAIVIIIRDCRKDAEAAKKAQELDVVKSMAQKIIVQIKACDDDTKTKIADIIANDKDMTVSDLTTKFILDKLQMTKEEIAQVNFTKGEAKLAAKDSAK